MLGVKLYYQETEKETSLFRCTLSEMSNAVTLIFCILITIETTLICVGNAFTVFVFWNQRASLKRPCYLLINLAVADLLVGATELIITATLIIPQGKPIFSGNVFVVIVCFFSSVSLLCLLVISLERAFAVVWPLRHRVANTQTYIISIVLVWAAGLCVMTVDMLSVYNIIPQKTSFLVVNSKFFICLCVIFATYMTIRNRLRNTNPAVEAHNRKTIEQNVKLSKTLFVVIGLSFAFWLPAITMYIVMAFCIECASEILMWIATVLHFANSLVNPIVYCYRMPMFKAAMNKLFKINTAN